MPNYEGLFGSLEISYVLFLLGFVLFSVALIWGILHETKSDEEAKVLKDYYTDDEDVHRLLDKAEENFFTVPVNKNLSKKRVSPKKPPVKKNEPKKRTKKAIKKR